MSKLFEIMKTQKLYFLDTSSEICHSLDYFCLEELEEVNYEIYEAVIDKDNKDFIFCSLVGELGKIEFCKKSQCNNYTSESDRGVCSHRGKLFKFGEKVNIKNLLIYDTTARA